MSFCDLEDNFSAKLIQFRVCRLARRSKTLITRIFFFILLECYVRNRKKNEWENLYNALIVKGIL